MCRTSSKPALGWLSGRVYCGAPKFAPQVTMCACTHAHRHQAARNMKQDVQTKRLTFNPPLPTTTTHCLQPPPPPPRLPKRTTKPQTKTTNLQQRVFSVLRRNPSPVGVYVQLSIAVDADWACMCCHARVREISVRARRGNMAGRGRSRTCTLLPCAFCCCS